MTALISLLIILTISLLITQVVTVALTQTGLSREAALFQAVSAFTGVGFTTREAETVVGHPVRRRIVIGTMILGNAGFVTAVSSLVLTFVGTGQRDVLIRLSLLAGGLAILWIAAISRWFNRHISRLITWALKRWTRLNVSDYAHLLNLSGDYEVGKIQVQAGDWLADRKLADLELNKEGILILGIHRADGEYVGAPTGQTYIRPENTLVLYGQSSVLADLDRRLAGASGNLAHEEAVVSQEHVLAEQARRDKGN